MNFLQALLLGVVEGFTEYLPISSTAHLIIASKILALTQTEFLKSFEIMIQTGAILAVVMLYWRRLLSFALWKQLIVAFIPTGVIGYFLHQFIKDELIGNLVVTLSALGLGGLGLIIFELWYARRARRLEPGASSAEITYRQCLLIGACQALAVIPGVSRAAATTGGGLLIGLGRAQIVEFSFLLAVPTMLAATTLDLVKNPFVLAGDNLNLLLIGFLTSFLVAIFSIKFLLHYIRQHTFTAFGVYRLALAVVIFLWLW